MDSKKLSVIIPVGSGRLKNLELVLTSLDCQTLSKGYFEVIVVNDGAESEMLQVIEPFKESLDLRYIWMQKFIPGQNMRPRNRGARLARYDFLVFVDSDVILHRDALALYSTDLEGDPNRIIAGMYHWLKPMVVTPADVRNRFDDIIEERLPEIPLEGPPTHNICRDTRLKAFEKYPPSMKLRDPVSSLWCLSGNICWPAWMFWSLGGFSNELSYCEDGALGIAAYLAGYAVSLDKDIVGGHLYHERNLAHLEAETQKCLKKIQEWYGEQLGEDLDDLNRKSNVCLGLNTE